MTDNGLWKVCQTQWSWPPCQHSTSNVNCMDCERTMNIKLSRLQPYLSYCQQLFERNGDLYSDGNTHIADAVIATIQAIRSGRLRKSMDMNTHLSASSTPIADRERLLHLTIGTMLMIRSGRHTRALVVEEHGLVPPEWTPDQNLSDFIDRAFPKGRILRRKTIRPGLTARALKKHAGLKFWPTNNLIDHLAFDETTGRVYIFHQVAFLKEQLIATKNISKQLSTAGYLTYGTLPRQLILETIDSIQKVLFPLSDDDSYNHLQSLTTRRSGAFDPECLRFDAASIRHDHEKDVEYSYFGARLRALEDELENPTARSDVAIWLQKRSGSRHVMLATLIGVVFAVILGIASLIVSSYQTYIAYQQWKHPPP